MQIAFPLKPAVHDRCRKRCPYTLSPASAGGMFFDCGIIRIFVDTNTAQTADDT